MIPLIRRVTPPPPPHRPGFDAGALLVGIYRRPCPHPPHHYAPHLRCRLGRLAGSAGILGAGAPPSSAPQLDLPSSPTSRANPHRYCTHRPRRLKQMRCYLTHPHWHLKLTCCCAHDSGAVCTHCLAPMPSMFAPQAQTPAAAHLLPPHIAIYLPRQPSLPVQLPCDEWCYRTVMLLSPTAPTHARPCHQRQHRRVISTREDRTRPIFGNHWDGHILGNGLLGNGR